MSLDWMLSAVCAGIDPELWHGTGGNITKAKRICASCPVRPQCEAYGRDLEGAASLKERHGVWGGTDAKTRSRRRKQARPVKDDRDARILRLVERGMTPQEIATQLDISDRTVNRVKVRTTERSAA
ncbi:WhiB family transcriptional regulator [Streptomyces globisporus]|uniref:WhiB family transcriptional regulator n=1 Tax=Streptomyces globisporus TaxID=1908 RepID=UPI00345FB3CD